jgi:bis(5'-nucleosidyl)-tetraphosphatase
MVDEISFGIIPLKKVEKEWHVLLINHKKGSFWAFPKGHSEKGETPRQAAERELFEETGLFVKKLLAEQTLSESYHFTRGKQLIHKTVVYFLAEVEGHVHLQVEEIYDSQWVKLSDAESHVTFPQAKAVIKQAVSLVPVLTV